MTHEPIAIRAIRVTHAIQPSAGEPWPFGWSDRLHAPVSVTHSLAMTTAECNAWCRAAAGETD